MKYEAEEDEMVAGDGLIAGEDDLADASERLDVAHDDRMLLLILKLMLVMKKRQKTTKAQKERLDDLQDKLDELIASLTEMNGEEEHSEEHSDDEPVSRSRRRSFDDITESIIDRLKKVEPVSQDGMAPLVRRLPVILNPHLARRSRTDQSPHFPSHQRQG